MSKVDHIRNGLINKILSIQNEEFLLALDKLIASSSTDDRPVELSEEQKLMLSMSEQDIIEGNISDENKVRERTMEWLKARKSQQ